VRAYCELQLWAVLSSPHELKLCIGPAVQLYLMDLCTYDSIMLVKVADASLSPSGKTADLTCFLDVAEQMLAARVRCSSAAESLTKRSVSA
jgi:hypothetical protein